MMAVIVTSIAFSSCKKSSTPAPVPSTTTSMKLTANGTALSFNDCQEVEIDVNDAPQTTFTGVNVTGGKPGDERFEVDIMHSPTTLKAGQTYPAATSFAQPGGSALFYYPNANDTYITQPKNPQGTVTITEVTATTISGTFSGKLFADNDFDGITVVYTITNGSFTAKINK